MIMGKLGPAAVQKMLEKRQAINEAFDKVVYEALSQLGGTFVGRSMDLRKHCAEALKESQIKDAIVRLVAAGKLTVTGNDNSRKLYKLVSKQWLGRHY
jgi:DNA-binding transcriptional regulator PaaX